MTEIPLDRAVKRYEQAIATLETAGETLSAEQILEVLVARDAIQAVINDTTQDNPGSLIAKVNELDLRLRKQTDAINRVVTLADLREIINPPQKDWWWLLDPPQPLPWLDYYDWLWISLALAFLTASASLTVDIAQRLLSSGSNQMGILGIVGQSVLTALTAGGALTKPGRQGVEHFLTTLKIPKRFWDELICILALFVLLIPLTIQSLLPQIGDYYKRLGDIAYCKVQVPSAEQAKELAQCQVQLATVEDHYSRASKIDPNDSEAHYKLGFFYEDLQEFERAISEYQIAVKGRIEGESYKAYSRLARLYILHGTKQDYSKAISLLNRALSLELIKKDKETTYAIHTYFGWTRLAQGRPIEASNLLQDAIKLFPNKAAAHCLLAQALDQQNDRKGATTQWEQCLSYANQKDPDEDAWIGLAVQRLKARGGGG